MILRLLKVTESIIGTKIQYFRHYIVILNPLLKFFLLIMHNLALGNINFRVCIKDKVQDLFKWYVFICFILWIFNCLQKISSDSKNSLVVIMIDTSPTNWPIAGIYSTWYSQSIAYLGTDQSWRCLVSVIVREPVSQRDMARIIRNVIIWYAISDLLTKDAYFDEI